MSSRTIEVGVGIFVALGLAALLVLAMKVSNLAALTGDGGYQIEARFDNVGGLEVRSPVKMGGVRIGQVVAIGYDDHTYEAVVHMRIRDKFRRIPTDSSASIFTSGLLGEQYVGISAGAEESYLENGSKIALTQSAVVLEQVIGQFLYSKAAGKGN